MQPIVDVLKAWASGLPFLGLALVAAFATARLMRRAEGQDLRPAVRRAGAAAVLSLGLAAGLRFAWGRMALFDDAYISLRYARNFAEGHGLVWNVGERVEGYTNFLWTLLLGLGIKFTSIDGPTLALFGSLAVFAATVLAVAALGRTLNAGYWLPIAAAATACNWTVSSYGTTGMETGLGALLVVLGVHRLVVAERAGGHAAAGLFFILATLTRPDHGLFYAVGSGIVGVEQLRRFLAGERRDAFLRCLGWAAPFALYVAYVVWKMGYYGHLLPNTYYAKSADLTWWSQGAIYAAMFWLGTNAWMVAVGAAVSASLPGGTPQRRFSIFTLAAVVLYTLYTAKVGGDFMFGRFFVTLVPLVLLATERAVFASLHRPLVAAALLFAMIASAAPVTLFDGTRERWGIVDENQYWSVRQIRPEVKLSAVHWKLGRFLHDEVYSQGLRPVIGSGGIGMVGYLSRLELVDSRGLTDAVIARQPLKKRNRPGHEKVAPRSYLLERKVNLLRLKGGQRAFHPERFRKVAKFSMRGAGIRDGWQIAHYDRALMEQLRAIDGVDFVDFDAWLDRYIARLDKKKPARVRKDLPWLKEYWFDHNDDPERLARLQEHARR